MPALPAMAVGAVAGLAIWLFIGAAESKEEAWDYPEFFTIGLPAMALVAFGLGIACPQAPGRAGAAVVLLQPVALILKGPIGPLIVIGIGIFAVLAMAMAVVAWTGSRLRRRPLRANS